MNPDISSTLEVEHNSAEITERIKHKRQVNTDWERSAPSVVERYAITRGITQEAQKQLGIRWASRQELIGDWGYGKKAVSPLGGILFPFKSNSGSFPLGHKKYPIPEGLSAVKNLRLEDGGAIEGWFETVAPAYVKKSVKLAKYLQPSGDRNFDFPFYDPIAHLKSEEDLATIAITGATEDIFGVIKAALRGHRIIGSFGVWLTKKKELEDYQENIENSPRFSNLIPAFLVDNDCYTKHQVFQAQVRNGLLLGCRVGTYPVQTDENGKLQKIGLDEAIDQEMDIPELFSAAVPAKEWLNGNDNIQGALLIAAQQIEAEFPNNSDVQKRGFAESIAGELIRHLGVSCWDDYKFGFKSLGIKAKDEFKNLDPCRKKTPGNDDEPPKLSEYLTTYLELKKAFGGCIFFNELTKRLEFCVSGTSKIEPLPLDEVRPKFLLYGDLELVQDKSILIELALKLGRENSYNPVQDYLSQVYEKYKQQQETLKSVRESLADRYLKSDDPLANVLLRKTLIAAIARVFDPGCKADTSTVLVGAQGVLKSTFWKILASPDWFCDDFSDPGNKDHLLKLHETWIVEWSELHGLSKREANHVKQFMASSRDLIRVPYGRSNEWMLRPSIIVGTSNESDFLTDATGNRRWWVIECPQKIDIEAVKTDRDLIWASAMSAYKADEPWWLDDHHEESMELIRKQYQKVDAWHDEIAQYIEDKDVISISEIYDCVLGMEHERRGHRSQGRISKILKQEDFEALSNPVRHEYFDGCVHVQKKQRVWKRKN